jgi:hypothetical protein
MKNVHILPTDKARLYIHQGKLYDNKKTMHIPDGTQIPQHIYITSDGEIKEGDYIFETDTNKVNIADKDYYINEFDFKIILTTDQNLIKDGVQSIDDTFLEWFVMNPSCEEVKVELFPKFSNELYGIIIPNEEPKQETLEEREPYWDLVDKKAEQNNTIDLDAYAKGVQDGVKWQAERLYSEEEVRDLILKFNNDKPGIFDASEWFEQFKKK